MERTTESESTGTDRQTRLVGYRIRLNARVTVLLAMLVITEASALMFSFAATLTADGITPMAFDLFSAVTALLAQRWVRLDASRPFSPAVRRHC